MRSILTVSALALLCSACAHSPPEHTASITQDHTMTTTPSSGDAAACGGAQVFFSNGGVELDDSARTSLDLYAGCLLRHEVDTITIVGMTDPAGGEVDNLILGRARALVVANYLHAAGCEVEFVIRSFGEVGALESEPLWPLERSAAISATTAP
jgi:outer membrane protein OmpA-like peptidoglycan-associated protein